MEPFVAALDGFHQQTAPSDWLEGLVKAYVGDSIASDFYREVAARLDSDTRDLVLGRARRHGARAASPWRRCGRRSTRIRASAGGSRCGRGG